MDVLIRARDLSKTIEGKLLFDHASFDVYSDNCIGLLGPNGCGKTTLFKILLGWERASTGDIWRADNLRMRYLDQVSISSFDETVSDFFIRTTSSDAILQKIRVYEKELEDPSIYTSSRYVEVLESIRKLKVSLNRTASSLRWEAACRILKEIGMPDLSPSTKPGLLSGGERQKIALASVLAQPMDCDLLFLDEPTNHLDIATIEWLERQIVDFPKAVMIVSHDRYLLDDLVDRVFEIENHHLEMYQATYEEYEEQKRLRAHIKIQAYEKSMAEIHRQKKVIETLSRRNKYDLQIASKIKRLEKVQRVENPVLKSYLLKFQFKSVFKSGKNVAEGQGLGKRFDKKVILDHANFEILAGQKIGLIGPNGCGKTTFLKMLIGEEVPDEGMLYISSGVRSGYFDQGHLSLIPENNLIDELRRDHSDLSESDAKAMLGQFNFRDDMFFNQVQQLSGGERARLSILRLLLQPFNVLLLDEPTNHMDMNSKTAIEGALNSYAGTVITVSHDRRFLDMVTDTIFFMEDGSLKTYAGNYTSFRLQRQKELTDLSKAHLAYLSGSGLKKYVVHKGFTIWATRTKHAVGEEVFIGDHNKKMYALAIKNRWLRPL
ncbi:MAG: ATP-binding cassette domain-containing protein [Candidatus Thermoplasmatota archaeon]|nr:ATP-binding cassette domain-containing protein [Candidatus Thermoplasmatota archaeon]MBU1940921.1 ATP-binding cassette domain-containing protein [Candidatus Thermoplasmatota archaeon]